MLSQFLQLTLAGVAQGCVYALVALGFVLIYKATETVNFAQGDLMMLGAFFGLTASTILGWPYWATILFAIVVMDISDRVVVLDYGKKIGDGSPDEVRNNKAVIDAYLGTH